MAAQLKHLTFQVPMKLRLQRFRELVVYIAGQCQNDPYFGAIKLNKILYYSDFRAYEKFGTPLTGALYFKLPLGPAPRAMIPVRNELISEGAIRMEVRDLGMGYEQHRIIALRPAVLQHFTQEEIAIVDDVIDELWSQNAAEVSDASHDVRWRTLGHKDGIPYEFAFLSDEKPTQSDIQRTSELIERFGWEP